jgi:hypothetical protein
MVEPSRVDRGKAEKDPRVIGHVETVRNALEYLQRGDRTVTPEDLGDAALNQSRRGGQSCLGRPAVPLNAT